ncbi:MAG: NAD-dependent protein deacetylase [Pseudomonadales bacterium]|nr:NAD-dependent protein deacetylase [Pseudomonadales bacterium]
MRAAPLKNVEPFLAQDVPEADIGDLQAFIADHPKLFVITGAGISRASGIPTYRDEVGTWKTNTPIQHGDFLQDPAIRQRYWARSFGGWPNVGNAQPNQAHRALARLEKLGYIHTLVTQNIDRLHQKAGHKRVIDLHGRLDQVVCMDCGALVPRDEIQQWLWQQNPHMDDIKIELAPDGDAHVRDELIRQVRVPSCQRCDGLLKPNVVFYGGSVGKEIVNYLCDKLRQADALLVIGTSLMVYSSFRFCKLAQQQDIPMVCINQGLTRADNLFTLKLAEDCAGVLTQLTEILPHRI